METDKLIVQEDTPKEEEKKEACKKECCEKGAEKKKPPRDKAPYPIFVQFLLVFCNMQAVCLMWYDDYAQEHVNWFLYITTTVFITTCALVAHWKAQFFDPGFLPVRLDAEGYRSFDENNEHSCRKCGADRTEYEPQVHHCSQCNRCVYKMDHHCMWTGNCVGATTRKYYFMFCLNVFLIISFQVLVSSILSDTWRLQLWEETSWKNISGYMTFDIWFLISPWRKIVWYTTPRAHILLFYAIAFLYMSSTFTCGFVYNVYCNTSEVNKVKKGYEKDSLTGIKDLIHELYGFNNNLFDYFLPTDTKVPLIIPAKV